MSGEIETSQAESDLTALEGFLVGSNDLRLCSTTSTSSKPPDGTGDGYEDQWMRRSTGSSRNRARWRALPAAGNVE
jgi:hypothetical protein